MQCGSQGITLAKSYEKCVLEAYKAPEAGHWVIGWGTTAPWVTEGMTCTQEQADNWFTQDMSLFANAVTKLIKTTLSQNQFDALCDFTYNCGPGTFEESSILTLIKQGLLAQVPHALQAYNKMHIEKDGVISVVISDDLTRRRRDEAELWNLP